MVFQWFFSRIDKKRTALINRLGQVKEEQRELFDVMIPYKVEKVENIEGYYEKNKRRVEESWERYRFLDNERKSILGLLGSDEWKYSHL